MQAGAKKFLSFWLSGGGLGLDYYPARDHPITSAAHRAADSSLPKQPSPERIGAGNESSSAVTGTTQLLGAPVVFLKHHVSHPPQHDRQTAHGKHDRGADVVAVVGETEGEERGEDHAEDGDDGSDAEGGAHGCSIPDRVRECKWGRERFFISFPPPVGLVVVLGRVRRDHHGAQILHAQGADAPGAVVEVDERGRVEVLIGLADRFRIGVVAERTHERGVPGGEPGHDLAVTLAVGDLHPPVGEEGHYLGGAGVEVRGEGEADAVAGGGAHGSIVPQRERECNPQQRNI